MSAYLSLSLWLVPLIPVLYVLYHLVIAPRFNPLQEIAGPPLRKWFGNHLQFVLDPTVSSKVHELYVKRYGRSIRIRGIAPWDERLLTLDPVSVAHVLKHTSIYEKPWQSRKLITSLIGCGMLAAEGHIHKLQRRVATPAFSVQNMRALVPLVFNKGNELKDRWLDMMKGKGVTEGIQLDVCHWISRATFDVIGLAGFDYDFNAIQDETNELFVAYKEMFEVAISQGHPLWTMITVYAPLINWIFRDKITRTVDHCQEVIHRVAGQLVREKTQKIMEAEKNRDTFKGRDLLSLLLKFNLATDLPPEYKISDDDILHNINTFMFAGSDTSSLTLTWTILLLAEHPDVQDRLRNELLSVSSIPSDDLSDEDIQSLYNIIADLPYLHNVTRECLRLIPPVHSSIRVATEDDTIPTMYPVHGRDGKPIPSKQSVTISKGSFVHVAVEAFNLDKQFWGDDSWEFNPDRWDCLPESANDLPGLFSNTLSFSAGPRSCIGMRFSLIEIKTFLFILITNFVFKTTEEKIVKANVVLTRPYVSGKYAEGSKCPLKIYPYRPARA
ncbi:cytochrome P450 [Cyathus striatus]|nr:cytochrome P450 [Cyathus striatus]